MRNPMVSIRVLFISQFVKLRFFPPSARIWRSDRYGRVNIFSFSLKEAFLLHQTIYNSGHWLIVCSYSLGRVPYTNVRKQKPDLQHANTLVQFDGLGYFIQSFFLPAWTATISVLTIIRWEAFVYKDLARGTRPPKYAPTVGWSLLSSESTSLFQMQKLKKAPSKRCIFFSIQSLFI